MPINQTRRLVVCDYDTAPEPEFTAENAHILRYTFGENQQIYIPSQSGLNLPVGAVESDARIATNGIAAIMEDAGVQTNIARIGGTTITLADVGYDLALRFANKVANGIGTRHKTVEIFAQHPDADWSEDNLIYTFIQENYANSKDGKRKVLTLKDVSRETTRTIFERKEWTLVQSVTENSTVIHVSAGDDDDFRFQRGPDDNFYPGENIGYMSFGSGSNREIWSYSSRVKMGENWYRYVVKQRGCFNSPRQAFTVNPNDPIENNETVSEFVYYREDVRDAMLMATVGRTFDGRIPPDHWTPKAPEALIETCSVGSSRFDHFVEIEEPPEQEAKAFYEQYLLSTMSDSVMRINRKGQLQLQPIDPAPPTASPAVVFDESNIDIGSLSPLKIKEDGLANPIIALWDYNPLSEDFQHRNIERDLIAEGIHGLSESKTIELPAFHSGAHSGSQVRQKILSASERYSYPTATISFDAVTSMRWVNVGTLARLTCPPGVVIDDSTGEAVDLDRAFLVIGRRYNPSTRKIRYFLWGTSGKAIEFANSQLTSHVPDSEFKRGAIDLSTVLTINNGVLSGIHSLAPGKYYYEGDLRLAPDFYCTFTRRGTKFQLCVLGALTIQSPNPFVAKGMGIHRGGSGALYGQRKAQTGAAGYFGRSVGGGGFDLTVQHTRGPMVQEDIPIYTFAGYKVTPTQGVTNSPPQTESVPMFDLAMNDGQFTGIPADLSGSGGAGGGPIWEYDSGRTGKAAEPNNEQLGAANNPPVPSDEHKLKGRSGAYGGMGIEFWSRGGGWDGAGGINTSGEDAQAGLGTSYVGLAAAPPGRSFPGVFVWIQDDPREPLPDMSSARVSAFTGHVQEEGARSGLEPFLRPSGVTTPLLHGYHAPPPRQNLASTAARAMYSPKPAKLVRRQNTFFGSLAISRQKDGQIELQITSNPITSNPSTWPSDGNPGDMGIWEADRAGTSLQPPAWVMNDSYEWVQIDWSTAASDYLTLLLVNRLGGGTISILSDTRPVGYPAGTHWLNSSDGTEWILGATAAQDKPFRDQGVPVGDELIANGNFAEGSKNWIFTRNSSLAPINVLSVLANEIAQAFITQGLLEGEFGDPESVVITNQNVLPVVSMSAASTSPTEITVNWTQQSDTTGIAGVEVHLDGVAQSGVSGSSHVITGLSPVTTYQVTVYNRGTNGNLSGPQSKNVTTSSEGSTGQLGIVFTNTGSPLTTPGRRVAGSAYQNDSSIVIEVGRTITLTLFDGSTYTSTVQADGAFEFNVPTTADANLNKTAAVYTNNGNDSSRAQAEFIYET